MNHKNYIGVSRKKTVDSMITQMEIIPQCCKLQETCVTERAIVDVNVEKYCTEKCLASKKKSNSAVNILYEDQPKMIDTGSDPIRFSKHLIDHKQSPTVNCKYRTYVLNSSNSSSSASSFTSTEFLHAQRTYTKNKGVQCEHTLGVAGKENDPFSIIQALLKDLKRKLKGDSYMSRILDELEEEIDRLFFGQTDSRNIIKSKYKINQILRNANRLTLPSNKKVEYYVEINEARAKLDATCRELEKTCETLKQERDTSLKLAADKSAELVETLVRETEIKRKLEETNYKITDISKKLGNYTSFLKNLNEQVKRLQYENREVKRLRQQVSNLNSLLRTMTKENKILLSDLQQVTIERNKLHIALTIQEQTLTKQNTELQRMSNLKQVQHMQSINEQWLQPVLNDQFVGSAQIMKPSSNVPTSSSSIGLAPSLCRIDSDNSSRTPSPSSDRLFQVGTLEAAAAATPEEEEEEDEEIDNGALKPFFAEQELSSIEHQLNLKELNDLKEEIKYIFAEVRHLASDIPSMSVVNFHLDESSNGINWSDVSHNISITD